MWFVRRFFSVKKSSPVQDTNTLTRNLRITSSLFLYRLRLLGDLYAVGARAFNVYAFTRCRHRVTCLSIMSQWSCVIFPPNLDFLWPPCSGHRGPNRTEGRTATLRHMARYRDRREEHYFRTVNGNRGDNAAFANLDCIGLMPQNITASVAANRVGVSWLAFSRASAAKSAVVKLTSSTPLAVS